MIEFGFSVDDDYRDQFAKNLMDLGFQWNRNKKETNFAVDDLYGYIGVTPQERKRLDVSVVGVGQFLSMKMV